MSDIVPPCDCAELVDGSWVSHCYCSNRDDGERTAAWCVEANHKAAADYDKCTIEFLRKEATEQAAEIERLRAALREDARDFANRIELLEGLVKQAQSIIDPCFPEKCHQWQKDARAALEERT